MRSSASPPPAMIVTKLRRGHFHSSIEAKRIYAKLNGAEVTDEVHAEIRAAISKMEVLEKARKTGSFVYRITPPGWLRDYLDYCVSSESPYVFHLLAALALLSHHIGRKMYDYLPGQSVFAPLSVFLCSPAGKARRGQATLQMGKVAKAARSTVYEGTATPERLIDIMMEQPHLLFVSEEASVLLNPKEYQKDIVPQLCRVIDGDDVFGIGRHTKARTNAVENPCVNLMLTSSPGMFPQMPIETIKGGLFSRLIMAWEDRMEREIAFPERIMSEKEVNKRAKDLAKDLRVIGRKATGKLKWQGSVANYYSAWYSDNNRAMDAVDDKLTSWYSRKPAHLKRVIMAFLAAQGRGTRVDQVTLDRAIGLLDYLEQNIIAIYRQASTSPGEKKKFKIITELTRNSYEMKKSALYTKCVNWFTNVKEFDQHVEDLREMGQIEYGMSKNKGKGRRAKIIRLVRGGRSSE